MHKMLTPNCVATTAVVAPVATQPTVVPQSAVAAAPSCAGVLGKTRRTGWPAGRAASISENLQPILAVTPIFLDLDPEVEIERAPPGFL